MIWVKCDLDLFVRFTCKLDTKKNKIKIFGATSTHALPYRLLSFNACLFLDGQRSRGTWGGMSPFDGSSHFQSHFSHWMTPSQRD